MKDRSPTDRFTSAIAFTTMAAGIVVLIGWALDIAVLKSILPNWFPMKANFAFAILLLGATLLLMTRPPAIFKPRYSIFFARLGSVLVGLIGLLTLGEYIFGWDLGIDQWLFREAPGAVGTSHPGRMAQEAALSLTLLATALLALSGSRKPRWSLYLSLSLGMLVTAFGLVALLSYLTPNLGPYGWFGFSIMAIHAATVLVLLGMAVVKLSWQPNILQWSLSKNTTLAFTSGLILLVMIGFNTSRSQVALKEINSQIAYNDEVLAKLGELQSDVIDSQSHTRGYIITGSKKLKTGYLEAKKSSIENLELLRNLETEHPQHERRFMQIKKEFDAALQWFQQSIDAKDAGISDAAQIQLTLKGDELQAIRIALFHEVENEHHQKILQLKQDAQQLSELSYRILFFGTLTSLLIFLAVIIWLNFSVRAQKLAEKKSHRMTQLYNALSQCNQAIVRCRDEDELFPQICRDAVQFGAMKMAWIGLLDKTSQLVKPVASFGAGTEYLEGIEISSDAHGPIGLGPTGTCIRENKPYWCQDFQHSPATAAWHERAASFGWGASASLPLLRNGEVVGALTVYEGEANAFDAATQDLLIEMAMDISYALDRFDTEAALLESNSIFNSFMEHSPIYVFFKDADTRTLRLSRNYEQMLGRPLHEVLGKTMYDLFPSALAQSMVEDDKRILQAGKPVTIEEELNGRSYSTIKFPIIIEGRPSYLAGYTTDITESRRAEKALRESEFRQRKLLENLHTAIIVHGPDTNIQFSNPHAANILGLTEEQLSGKLAIDPAWHFVDEQGKTLASNDFPINRVLATLRPFDNVVLGINAPGRNEITWVMVGAFPEFDSNGELDHVVVNFHDITLLRNAERLVKESADIFQKTFNLAAVGIARIAPDGSWLEVNERICEIVGYTKAELLNLTFQDITHPDDLDIDLGYVQQMLAGSIQTYSLQKRYMHKDGHIVWINLSVALVRDEEGAPRFFISIVEDISLRKHAESQLLKLSMAVEQSSNTIVITDLDARIEYANANFTKITGYSLQEAIGQNPRILQSGKTPKATYDDMWAHLRAGQEWRGELYNRRKDGSEYVETAIISPVRQPSGEITHYLAIKQDISDKINDAARIQNLAQFDQLTGLPNRIQLNDRFSYALSLSQRSGEPLAVMFIDLDHFKNINDTLGHSIGDKFLIEVAQRLKATLRDEDTLSRFGGDEFIIVLPGTEADGAALVASKLIEAVSKPYQIDHHELVGTPSIGIAIYPYDGNNFEDLLKNADTAMYRVKQDNRNDFRFFTAAMQLHSERNLQLVNALRHALDRNELQLHYQPQVTLQDGHITGAEALLRWQHPELGNISPAEFIPIAEDSGQIIAIGEWVLRTAVKQMKAWQESGLPPMVVAVNLSAIQFRQPNLPELVTRILEEAQLPPQYLELELTEAVAMDDPQTAVQVMDDLFARGVRMSIDDFGTGYSSLSYLKRFKVYKLKIDQSFVRDISVDPEDKAIVTAIINLASSLGMQTIAEGVETASQLAFLRLQGCNEVQGYYFSKPLKVDQFEKFIIARDTVTPAS